MQPFRVIGGFTADANGNGTDTRVIGSGHWASVYASVMAESIGNWSLGTRAGPEKFQTDDETFLGPIILQPGEWIVTKLADSQPNAPVTVIYTGWLGDANDGSDLAPVSTSQESNSSSPGSIAQQSSVLAAYTSIPLVQNGTVNFTAGLGTSNPYPSQVGSWLMEISGLAVNTNNGGCRVLWQGSDSNGNLIYQRQRDSAELTYGSVIATGDVDAPQIEWSISLGSAAGTSCTARLYFSAESLKDYWYDTAVYGPAFASAGGELGMDGTLLSVQNVGINAGSNATFTLLTYRGPVQIGAQASQASFLAIQESTYTGGTLRLGENIPISSSGTGFLLTIAYLGGVNNAIEVFNTSASNMQVFLVVRALEDLV